MTELKEDLLSFDFLSNQSKVELWLTYKNIKPASAFPIKNGDKKTYKEEELLLGWIQKIGLFVKKDLASGLYLVSRKQELIAELLPIIFSNIKEDIEKKCTLYGYPKETALAAFRNFTQNKDGLPVGVGLKKDNPFNITWWPYVRYVVREGFEYEDSLAAKAWQEEIIKELPELDRLFCEDLIAV